MSIIKPINHERGSAIFEQLLICSLLILLAIFSLGALGKTYVNQISTIDKRIELAWGGGTTSTVTGQDDTNPPEVLNSGAE